MKKYLSILLTLLCATPAFAQVEANQSQAVAGTAGWPYVMTPRRTAAYVDSVAFGATLTGLTTWSAGTDYAAEVYVSHNGSSWYAATNPTTGEEPGVASDWIVVASKGDTGATGATGAAGSNGTNGTNGADGATGATGAAGADGDNGTNGVDGKTWYYTASGTPSDATGVNGDYMFRGSDGSVFLKAAGTWGSAVFSLSAVTSMTIDTLTTGSQIFTEAAAPSTPAASKVTIYAKTDGLLYSKDDAGTETLVSGGAGGASTTIDALGDAAGDGSIAVGAHEIDFTSTIDAAGEAVFTITNTDADAANDNSLFDLKHNDGADANVFYLRMIGDADGTPTNDFLFSQAGFTALLPINPPSEAYDATGWNGDTGAPQKDAVRDQMELKANLAGGNTFTGTQVFPSGQALIAPALGTIASGVGTALTALNGENVQDDTIDDDSIDFGTSTDQVSAVDIPIADTGSIFTATEVEAALLELAKVPTKATAASYTVGTTDSREFYGGVIYVTGASTITIPAVAAGASFTVITIGAVAVSVDPNASDLIYLNGTALADGDKITNASTTGDIAVFTYYDATGWYATTNTGWTDTN